MNSTIFGAHKTKITNNNRFSVGSSQFSIIHYPLVKPDT